MLGLFFYGLTTLVIPNFVVFLLPRVLLEKEIVDILLKSVDIRRKSVDIRWKSVDML
ncbi:hypothetical protein J2Y67_001751 [Neobacillus niacini]|nr:hypothetical protein [Neobacillus niacini]